MAQQVPGALPVLSAQRPMEVSMGPLVTRDNIHSSAGPFKVTTQYAVDYPRIVVDALVELYDEYNAAFAALVAANTEWEGDYQYCMQGGRVVNWMVQIDMVGLGAEFLANAEQQPVEAVREELRQGIFEIENSVAGYQLLGRLFPSAKGSVFKNRLCGTLESLRRRTRMPIALLTPTEEKAVATKAFEFGKDPDQRLSDQEVRELSGFDRFFGPRQFLDHLRRNGGCCSYLLYVRASSPLSKLRRPKLQVAQPLFSDPKMRQLIRQHSLTLNIDDPHSDRERRINDSKGYMEAMGMGLRIHHVSELLAPRLNAHLASGGNPRAFQGERLSAKLQGFLRGQGLATSDGRPLLRAKPMQEHYGCYGHHVGAPEGRFLQDLRRDLRQRGPYIIQPERRVPVIIDTDTGQKYQMLDRFFVSSMGGRRMPMGGFRSLMPLTSEEGRRGRNHGNRATVWAEITA